MTSGKREPTALQAAEALRAELAAATTPAESVITRERIQIYLRLFRKRRKQLADVIPLIETRLSAERQIGQQLIAEGEHRGTPKSRQMTSGQVLGGTDTPLPPGLSKQAAHVYRTLALLPDATWSEWLAEARSQMDALTKDDQARLVRELTTQSLFSRARREYLRPQQQARLEQIGQQTGPTVDGTYDVLVIDPPWPMQKIERDERPNQVAFDYPTLGESELAELRIPASSGEARSVRELAAEACHVWLWTTHRFLPMAFRLLSAWDLSYVCMFVWLKPGGFQPLNLPQFNCEFALYARKGSPTFATTKAFFTAFEAPRTQHSEKPDVFFENVARVTAGRRLELFARRPRPGFEGWGNEYAHA